MARDRDVDENAPAAAVIPSFWETKKFRYIIIGSSFGILLVVFGSFFGSQYWKQRQIRLAEETYQEEKREYEDRFRSVMTRVYQNLKLDHYLAAFKNAESLGIIPGHLDPLLKQEYLDVLHRIARGLLENNLLRESESVYETLRNMEGFQEYISQAQSEIESKRKLENSRILMAEGERLIKEKRFQDAYGELKKSEMELKSVELYKFDDTKKDWLKLLPLLKEAKFYHYIEDAAQNISKAQVSIKNKKFEDAQKEMAKAANLVGRAAFQYSDSKEVELLRTRLFELDAELGYQIPNHMSLVNTFKQEEEGKIPYYFFLTDYDFGGLEKAPSIEIDHKKYVDIGFRFTIATPKDRYFLVRYRIFFHNGKEVFNGYALQTDPDNMLPVQSMAKTYRQEIPDEYKDVPIKRIEVRIFNDSDQMVAKVTRAFRKNLN